MKLHDKVNELLCDYLLDFKVSTILLNILVPFVDEANVKNNTKDKHNNFGIYMHEHSSDHVNIVSPFE